MDLDHLRTIEMMYTDFRSSEIENLDSLPEVFNTELLIENTPPNNTENTTVQDIAENTLEKWQGPLRQLIVMGIPPEIIKNLTAQYKNFREKGRMSNMSYPNIPYYFFERALNWIRYDWLYLEREQSRDYRTPSEYNDSFGIDYMCLTVCQDKTTPNIVNSNLIARINAITTVTPLTDESIKLIIEFTGGNADVLRAMIIESESFSRVHPIVLSYSDFENLKNIEYLKSDKDIRNMTEIERKKERINYTGALIEFFKPIMNHVIQYDQTGLTKILSPHGSVNPLFYPFNIEQPWQAPDDIRARVFVGCNDGYSRTFPCILVLDYDAQLLTIISVDILLHCRLSKRRILNVFSPAISEAIQALAMYPAHL